MLHAKARNDVMFAHYAVRRNIIHAVNITAAGNITCPSGQTSFSVIVQEGHHANATALPFGEVKNGIEPNKRSI